jgi:hypothetical protein
MNLACTGGAKAYGPYQACGRSISNFPGFLVINFSPGRVVEPSLPIVVLVKGCDRGALVTISPPTMVGVAAFIRSQDGN